MRKKVFNGNIINVFSGYKKLPTGKKAFFEEVEHPGAAIIVPFIKNKIVFIRQYRAVIGKYIWELPAGTLEPGETPFRCAKREVQEETGYAADSIRKLGYIYTTPGFCNEKIHIFRADCSRKSSLSLDENEVIKVKLFSRSETISLFSAGRINDSKTIAALSFAGVL